MLIELFRNKTNTNPPKIANGTVKIIINGVTAYGDFSKYQVDNEELLLEGNVVVIEKDNKIQSDQLILDLASSTSIMTAKSNSLSLIHI